MFWIKFLKSNDIVTGYYLNIIKSALEKAGEKVDNSYSWEKIKIGRDDIAVVAHSLDALKMILGRHKYFLWCQGIWPEESYLKHKSKLRLFVLSFLERLAITHASYLFFVSEQMKNFYEKKYHLSFKNNYYIMPCVNDIIHEKSFSNEKYKTNIFCYAGALSKWQCFEKTIELYKQIEDKYPSSKLMLLVRDKEQAILYLKKYKIKNYEIDFVPVSDLPKKLLSVKFGFLLRENDPVNHVATPTKLMTYLGNGVIPIYSNSLSTLNGFLSNTRYKVCYKNDNDISAIEEMMHMDIAYSEVKAEYMQIYDDNFNKEKHINELSKAFRGRY